MKSRVKRVKKVYTNNGEELHIVIVKTKGDGTTIFPSEFPDLNILPHDLIKIEVDPR